LLNSDYLKPKIAKSLHHFKQYVNNFHQAQTNDANLRIYYIKQAQCLISRRDKMNQDIFMLMAILAWLWWLRYTIAPKDEEKWFRKIDVFFEHRGLCQAHYFISDISGFSYPAPALDATVFVGKCVICLAVPFAMAYVATMALEWIWIMYRVVFAA
jgi:hypothetical protein